eukprot:jgi/Mesen1/4279/ME000022S03560
MAYNKPYNSQTKIIGTLGQQSRSPEIIEALLAAGMTVARFDFSQGDADYHQVTLDNLRAAIRKTKKLCAVMLDTVGPELTIVNKEGKPIQLTAGGAVTITPDVSKPISSDILPIAYTGLAKSVKPGNVFFLGQYLFTGSESTSVYMEVVEIKGNDVICHVKNSATLSGTLFTLHAEQTDIDLPTLSDYDREIISTWGKRNEVDFVSLSFTRHPDDIRELRALLDTLGDFKQTQVFAKIENVEGLKYFDEILKEADGFILSRGNLGIDLPPEKVFLFQKAALSKCNRAGKPVVITRVVDTMTETPRPTRAEATDVANAVLDGCDAIMLGAETLRGLYPVESVVCVRKIAAEAEKVYNQENFFKKTVKAVGEPMGQLESIASSAVRAAEKVRASVIIVFTSSGRAAKLIAKYKPSMPALVVVIPKLTTDQLTWKFTGAFQARQCLLVRGLFPILADPRHPGENTYTSSNESILKVALDHGKAAGIIKIHDRIVVVQKLGDSAVVKIIELEE